MFWFAAICFALVYVSNTVLALVQSRNYTATYTALKHRGRVAIGKKKGLVTTGAIVMFLIDEHGTIVEGTRLTGITVLARFRPLAEFDGLRLATISATGDRRFTRSVRRAIENARDNYLRWKAGQIPQDPPGPLALFADALRRLVGRTPKHRSTAQALAEAATATPIPATQRTRLPQPR